MCLSCLIVACCGHSCRGSRNRGMKPLRGEKFMAQWHPLCCWRSHFPRAFHAFRLYCIDFHAWNSLILRDNIMDAIWCKEWPIFNTGSLAGYSETPCSGTNHPDWRFLSLCTESHLLPALLWSCQMVWGEVFTKWHGPPRFFMALGSPYHGLLFQVTAGRWMEQGILGWVVYSFRGWCISPQGLGEIALQPTGAAWLQMRRSYSDQRLVSDVKSRATETSLCGSALSTGCP